mmetsp:Transcript_3790/g.9846  ORF Transcript_3790/g.9846 Transcript_3790/m.9846 type:complete len:285 (+) Transcript_3790:437-1291(+)
MREGDAIPGERQRDARPGRLADRHQSQQRRRIDWVGLYRKEVKVDLVRLHTQQAHRFPWRPFAGEVLAPGRLRVTPACKRRIPQIGPCVKPERGVAGHLDQRQAPIKLARLDEWVPRVVGATVDAARRVEAAHEDSRIVPRGRGPSPSLPTCYTHASDQCVGALGAYGRRSVGRRAHHPQTARALLPRLCPPASAVGYEAFHATDRNPGVVRKLQDCVIVRKHALVPREAKHRRQRVFDGATATPQPQTHDLVAHDVLLEREAYHASVPPCAACERRVVAPLLA